MKGGFSSIVALPGFHRERANAGSNNCGANQPYTRPDKLRKNAILDWKSPAFSGRGSPCEIRERALCTERGERGHLNSRRRRNFRRNERIREGGRGRNNFSSGSEEEDGRERERGPEIPPHSCPRLPRNAINISS